MERGEKCTIEHASKHARDAILLLREGVLESYLMFSPDIEDKLPKTLHPREIANMTPERQIEFGKIMKHVGRMLFPDTEVEILKIIS